MTWSVQIAAYEGSTQRKKFAVDAVRDARAEGVPAYYYHGPSISSVCVGAWPRAAVRGDMEPAFNDPNERRSLDQILSQQPSDLIVLPPGMPAVNKEVRPRPAAPRDQLGAASGGSVAAGDDEDLSLPLSQRRGRGHRGEDRGAAQALVSREASPAAPARCWAVTRRWPAPGPSPARRRRRGRFSLRSRRPTSGQACAAAAGLRHAPVTRRELTGEN